MRSPVSRSLGVGETQTLFYDFDDDALPFKLQSGETLAQVRLAYELYGEINDDRSNVVLVFHALTGSQHASGWTQSVDGVDKWSDECRSGWWSQFVGPGLALDTDRYAVLCVNYVGGCYGSTGPASPNPKTGKPYGGAFPELTLSDIVDSQLVLLNHLGIETLHAVTGGSVGGMMSLSLAIRHPDRVRKVMPIAAGLHTTALQFVHNFEQTNAILNDPAFNGGDYYDGAHPDRGLALARMIGHKTFVSLEAMRARARGEVTGAGPDGYEMRHPLESYMWHQGQRFLERFDANTYVRLMTAWQHFELLLEAGLTSMSEALARSRQHEYLLFSIDSDVCFYPEEQIEMRNQLEAAGVPVRHENVISDKGHDAFLLEPHLFEDAISEFLDS